jgi:hypothetical protein
MNAKRVGWLSRIGAEKNIQQPETVTQDPAVSSLKCNAAY